MPAEARSSVLASGLESAKEAASLTNREEPCCYIVETNPVEPADQSIEVELYRGLADMLTSNGVHKRDPGSKTCPTFCDIRNELVGAGQTPAVLNKHAERGMLAN